MAMHTSFRQLVWEKYGELERRWRAYLYVEAAPGPLTHPETLARLIPDAVGALVKGRRTAPRVGPVCRSSVRPYHCGFNPYAPFYLAGEQALAETAVHSPVAITPAAGHENELAGLMSALRRQARADVNAFCGVCILRGRVAGCPKRARKCPSAVPRDLAEMSLASAPAA